MSKESSHTFEKQIILFSAGIITLSVNGAISLRGYYSVDDISRYSGFLMIGIVCFLPPVVFSLSRLRILENTQKFRDLEPIKHGNLLETMFRYQPSVLLLSFLLGLLLILFFFFVNLFNFGLSAMTSQIIYKGILIIAAIYILIAGFVALFSKRTK